MVVLMNFDGFLGRSHFFHLAEIYDVFCDIYIAVCKQ